MHKININLRTFHKNKQKFIKNDTKCIKSKIWKERIWQTIEETEEGIRVRIVKEMEGTDE